MSAEDVEFEILGADSAHSAAQQTVAAIDEAARVNDDPAVVDVLADAAVKADQTSPGSAGSAGCCIAASSDLRVSECSSPLDP